jgi:hypothetical protein
VEEAMSIIHNDPTRFFSVVGAPYVGERHIGDDHEATPAPNAEPSLAASWVVLISLLAGIVIFAGEISILSTVGLTTDVRAAAIQ